MPYVCVFPYGSKLQSSFFCFNSKIGSKGTPPSIPSLTRLLRLLASQQYRVVRSTSLNATTTGHQTTPGQLDRSSRIELDTKKTRARAKPPPGLSCLINNKKYHRKIINRRPAADRLITVCKCTLINNSPCGCPDLRIGGVLCGWLSKSPSRRVYDELPLISGSHLSTRSPLPRLYM